MTIAAWATVIGLLLVLMALADSVIDRMPLSTAMFYLGVGVMLSPAGLGLASLTPTDASIWLEHGAEVAVLLSLFTSGMKMSLGISDRRWFLPIRLATVSMLITVTLVAAAGVWLLGLPIGAAILLGGMLAPTDPVLASDVNVSDPADRDRLRFSLTGEAGLNDGTAFPIVLLGLSLVSTQGVSDWAWRWALQDVLWASASGIAIGAILGEGVGRLVLYLRREHKESTGLDNFIDLGLIAVAYGVAVQAHGYGFLAVFSAGVALRHVEQRATSAAHGGRPPAPRQDPSRVESMSAEDVATHPQHAPAYLAHAVLSFNEQLERIGELALVLVLGLLLWTLDWKTVNVGFLLLMLLVIRPLSVWAGLAGARVSVSQRRLIGWFGIRGIGSIYYLMYAINHGIEPALAQTLTTLVLSVIVVSVVVHGISVTPLMGSYETRKGGKVGGKADGKAGVKADGKAG